MTFLPVLTALMMVVGIYLIMRGLVQPEEKPETIANRLDQYGARPMTLEEIELQKPFSERMIKPIMDKMSTTMANRAPQKTLEGIRSEERRVGKECRL